jgi:putative ABC transport system permease protein
MFGSDPRILSRSLSLPQMTYPIVGVMPPGFRFPDTTDIWIPLVSGFSLAKDVPEDTRRASRAYRVVARLRPGASIAQAQGNLDRIAAELEQEHPVVNMGIRPVITTLRDAEVGSMRPYLLLLMGGTSLVLLLCCVNIAILFLAKFTARSREISIRLALGAGHGVLTRQSLIEGLLLSVTGGFMGLAIAFGAIQAFRSLIPVPLPFWMLFISIRC